MFFFFLKKKTALFGDSTPRQPKNSFGISDYSVNIHIETSLRGAGSLVVRALN
jgi:hypothetical protein